MRWRPSCGGTGWMTREVHVGFGEGLGVKFPGPALLATDAPNSIDV